MNTTTATYRCALPAIVLLCYLTTLTLTAIVLLL